MAQSGYVVQITKSRKNILDQLEKRGYNVDNYKGSSIAQVHVMFQNSQLDMLVENPDTKRKAYVKYHLGKSLRSNNIMDMIDDLYTLDTILTNQDDLIIIAKDNANESMEKTLRNIWEKMKYLITVIGINQIQFNILEHTLVPPHRVLTSEEAKEIKKRYNIVDVSQLPDISRFSPVSLALGIRPGEMCEILRPSRTAITAPFYRICSA